ncbi:MAG: tpaAb [Herminiimonas sp.]|nr:tpaAb [Herminiimonas sp.]MDB5853601.1 tpaAb [Herminiimonas sp.]
MNASQPDRHHRVVSLVGDYAHCIDEEEYESWPEFFTDDCYYQVTSRESYKKAMPIGIFQCNSKGMLVDRIYSMRKANIFEPHRYRHLLGATKITGEQDGVIESITSFAVVRIMDSGKSDLFLSGVYRDSMKEVGDQLKLSKRIVVLDSSRVDTLIVLPI